MLLMALAGCLARLAPETASPPPGEQKQTGAAPAQSSAARAQDRGNPPREDEIVVTGRRWGQADIPSETELDANQIRAYGARSISELISDVTPLIDGGGDAPAILVNGKRIGDSGEITGYPPEALNRAAILPPQAAAHYGFPAGKRVINLELKQHYASWDGDAGVGAPTAGGRHNAQLSVRRTAINGNTRWNAQASLSDETLLRKSERRIPVQPDMAALVQTLQAGAGGKIDPDAFESVAGATRYFNTNISASRPLGNYAISLNLSAALNRSRQLTGLPIGVVILPPGSPWVPAGEGAVTTSRLLRDAALESRQRSQSLGMSASLSGALGGWQTSLSLSYTRSRSQSLYDRGYDMSVVQALADSGDPGFDPYGSWPETPLRFGQTRSGNDMLGANFSASKSILQLPAGQASTSLTVSASRNRAHSTVVSAGELQRSRSAGDQVGGRWSLVIPVSNRALDVLAPLGDLGLDLSGEVTAATGTGTRRKWDATVRWTPFSFLNLRASLGRESSAPTFDQLRGPRIEIVTRLFDYVQQDYALPRKIFGGNPELAGGSNRNFSLSAMMRPLAGDLATLNIAYRKQASHGGVMAFPVLTPEVEAAFPDRIVRDANARLVSIDARPINISQDRTESVTSGLVLRYTEKPGRAQAASQPSDGFQPWTFSLSINHSWQLRSETLIRPGLPVLDRLRNNGQPRHNVALGLVAGRPGFGATLNGNWSSAARVRSGGAAGAVTQFRYASSALFNLDLFVEPGEWVGGAGERNWASGLRLSLDLQNVLNGYRNVSVRSGGAVRNYARDEVDPLGRVVRLSVQKQF